MHLQVDHCSYSQIDLPAVNPFLYFGGTLVNIGRTIYQQIKRPMIFENRWSKMQERFIKMEEPSIPRKNVCQNWRNDGAKRWNELPTGRMFCLEKEFSISRRKVLYPRRNKEFDPFRVVGNIGIILSTGCGSTQFDKLTNHRSPTNPRLLRSLTPYQGS